MEALTRSADFCTLQLLILMEGILNCYVLIIEKQGVSQGLILTRLEIGSILTKLWREEVREEAVFLSLGVRLLSILHSDWARLISLTFVIWQDNA